MNLRQAADATNDTSQSIVTEFRMSRPDDLVFAALPQSYIGDIGEDLCDGFSDPPSNSSLNSGRITSVHSD